MESCRFDIDGMCYAIECHYLTKCGCKDSDGCVKKYASMDEMKLHESRVYTGEIVPRIVVMPPTVVNVSVPLDENVALEGLDTEQSVILPRVDDVKTK